VLRESDSPYTNRIHADDLAAVCIAAMERGHPGAAYNVSDGNPTTMCDYFTRIAARTGLPPPTQVDRATAKAVLSPGMLSFLGESKRLKTDKLMTELGVCLQYPDLDAGLAAIDCDQP
jgi:nucleoside-diphosphate-sugar epimerase